LHLLRRFIITEDGIVYMEVSVTTTNSVLRGIGASHGKVKGIVKVLSNPMDLIDREMSRGMKTRVVLVTQYTTPMIGAFLDNIAAIVTEMGGVTSHGAIIAREMGIPCVVSVKNASKELRDGMTVIVDGKEGVVYIS